MWLGKWMIQVYTKVIGPKVLKRRINDKWKTKNITPFRQHVNLVDFVTYMHVNVPRAKERYQVSSSSRIDNFLCFSLRKGQRATVLWSIKLIYQQGTAIYSAKTAMQNCTSVSFIHSAAIVLHTVIQLNIWNWETTFKIYSLIRVQ